MTSEAINSLLTFLEPLNVYDREELLPSLVEQLDDCSRISVRRVLDEKFFMVKWYSEIPREVKARLAYRLSEAIQNVDFDFEWLISEASGTSVFPYCFEGRARMVYEEIYRAVFEHWGDELKEIGLILMGPSDMKIPASDM